MPFPGRSSAAWRPVLVCFALSQEAAPFRRRTAGRTDLRIAISGVGGPSAARWVRAAIDREPPALVLTCGYAGALDPALNTGDVLFDADKGLPLIPALVSAGARAAKFHCAARIVTTAAEKAALRRSTGADAVEMESGIIRRVCAEAQIPAATVRVISDRAGEDLPLDFNRLSRPDQSLHPLKLAWAIAKSPRRIPALLALGRQCRHAGQRLAEALSRILPPIA